VNDEISLQEKMVACVGEILKQSSAKVVPISER